MHGLRFFIIFTFMLLFFQQSWSQEFELVGTNPTDGFCNGEIELVFTGEEDFNYEWNTGETGNKRIGDICPGLYGITITLPDGCVIELELQLFGTGCYLAIDKFSVEIVDYCNDKNLGSISLTSGFGLPYDYLWSNESTGPSITNLTTGTYCVTITSPEGGENECEVNICHRVKFDRSCSKSGKSMIDQPIGRVELEPKGALLIVNEWAQSGFVPLLSPYFR